MPTECFKHLNFQKRQKILSAMKMLFFEKPYKEITIRDIVQRAGISKTSFYQYFSCKSDIFKTMILWEKERMERKMVIYMTETGNYEETMNHISEDFIEGSAGEGCRELYHRILKDQSCRKYALETEFQSLGEWIGEENRCVCLDNMKKWGKTEAEQEKLLSAMNFGFAVILKEVIMQQALGYEKEQVKTRLRKQMEILSHGALVQENGTK